MAGVPHIRGCWFCFLNKLMATLGFAAIGIVCVCAMVWDAAHHHYLTAAKDLVGYFIALVAISVVPKLIDGWSGLLDRVLPDGK
jgi:hypothetical protein